VTVTKSEDYGWAVLKPDVFAAIMDHYSSGEPLLYDQHDPGHTEHLVNEDDDEVRLQGKEGGEGEGGEKWGQVRRDSRCLGAREAGGVPRGRPRDSGVARKRAGLPRQRRLSEARCSLRPPLPPSRRSLPASSCGLTETRHRSHVSPSPPSPPSFAAQVVAMIKELLETRIRPAVQEDGGDIVFRSWDPDTGVVKLKMMGACRWVDKGRTHRLLGACCANGEAEQGACRAASSWHVGCPPHPHPPFPSRCSGCPSSAVTLKSGIENMLMHYIPEVQAVEEAEPDEGESEGIKAFHRLEQHLSP
jgi:Fe-S cluster biogenesis protein NfuA